MLNQDIRSFFGQLNFAVLVTNVPNATILRNDHNDEKLFVVLLESDGRQLFSTGMISAIQQKICSAYTYPDPEPRILFLVLSPSPARERTLADIPGVNVWFVDSVNCKLMIYENQISDFYGLRYGLEQTIAASGRSVNPWNLREAVKDRKTFPFVTVALIAANVIWFIVLSFMGDTTDPQFMWSMGADFGYSVFVDHEFYRLFLSMFMHFGFTHLAGNMIYLGVIGVQTEKLTGHLRFCLIYFLSGLAASVISTAYYYLTDYHTVSAGASGAIYGIIGLLIYLTGRNRGKMGRRQMSARILIVLVFLFYSNFVTTGVDVVAHIAGFIAGLLLSFAFLHPKKDTK